VANENEESEDMRARTYVSPSEAEAWVKHRVHRMNVSLEEYKLSPISWQVGSTIWSLSCRTKGSCLLETFLCCNPRVLAVRSRRIHIIKYKISAGEIQSKKAV